MPKLIVGLMAVFAFHLVGTAPAADAAWDLAPRDPVKLELVLQYTGFVTVERHLN